ncbi:MAG TPA: hypothetical protein VGB03_00550, partial [Acidimicrobiales bacterium]
MPVVDSHAREEGGRGRDSEYAYRTIRTPAPERPSTGVVEPPHDDARTLGAVAAGKHQAIDPGAVVRLQRSMGNAVVARAVKTADDEQKSAVEAVKTGGSPLPDAVRTEMEEKLGADLGHV